MLPLMVFLDLGVYLDSKVSKGKLDPQDCLELKETR